MKKFLIISVSLLILAGCSNATDEEKEKMLYDSLEKAYIAVYSSEGVGLAVYPDKTLMIDEKTWYQVGISEYEKVSQLTDLADEVYTEKIAKKINKAIKNKYRETTQGLYTLSEGGCALKYLYDENIRENIKNDVKINKIGGSKIKFEYNGKEYEAKLTDDTHYVFDKQIFECPKED